MSYTPTFIVDYQEYIAALKFQESKGFVIVDNNNYDSKVGIKIPICMEEDINNIDKVRDTHAIANLRGHEYIHFEYETTSASIAFKKFLHKNQIIYGEFY